MDTRESLENCLTFVRAELEAIPEYEALKLRIFFTGGTDPVEKTAMPYAIHPQDAVTLIRYLEAGLREYDRLAALMPPSGKAN